METALWVAQGLLAAVFLITGGAKLTQPKEKLMERMEWAENVAEGPIKMLGAVELLAAVGLILPGITGIAPILIPLAAIGTILVQIGAIVVHARRSETQRIIVNLVFTAIAVFVVWGRFGDYPL